MTGEEIKKQVHDAFACDDMFYRPELRDAIYEMVGENAKLKELCKRVLKNCYDAYEQVWGWDDDWVILCDEARELGIEVEP